jgi:hypothetical protein
MSRFPVVFLVAVAAGCGDYPSGGSARSCEAVPYEARCSAFAAAWTARELRCGWLDPADADGYRLLTRDWTCGGDRPADDELAGLLAAGAIRYDARETGCAVDWLRVLACGATDETLRTALDPILAPLVPATPVGEPCTDTVQCVDSYCPVRVCGRTCTPFPAAGEACDDELPCGPDDACGREGRCVPRPDVGEPCGDGCELPYVCLSPGDGSPDRCFDYVRPGQPCDRFHRCATGCVDVNPETGVGTCASEPGEGQPCTGTCAAGLACDPASRTCVRALHPGDACEPDASWRCAFAPFYTCDPDDRRCTVLPGIGGACDGDAALACRLGACADGVCAWPAVSADVPCTEDWNCGDDRICERGRCVAGCR